MMLTVQLQHLFFSIAFTIAVLPSMTYAITTTTITPFNLSAAPDTDIWRKPPSHDVFTAPTNPSPLHKIPLASFQRARLTFALPPGNTLRQYDQAGIVIRFTKDDNSAKEKWIKSGIEWYYGKPYVSTVGTHQWSDWSIVPLTGFAPDSSRPSSTIEARRERDQLGKSLWIYQLTLDDEGKEVERFPLREINWAFVEEEGWSVGVGGMVARPTKEGGEEELTAEFERGVEIEVLDCNKKL